MKVKPPGFAPTVKSAQQLDVVYPSSSAGNVTINGLSVAYKDYTIAALDDWEKAVISTGISREAGSPTGGGSLAAEIINSTTVRVYRAASAVQRPRAVFDIFELHPHWNVEHAVLSLSGADYAEELSTSIDVDREYLTFFAGLTAGFNTMDSQGAPGIYFDIATAKIKLEQGGASGAVSSVGVLYVAQGVAGV